LTESSIRAAWLKMPMYSKASGFAVEMASVCIPPMDRPATARCAEPGATRYVRSTNGTTSVMKLSG
jgi:hypothetical protein